MTNPGHASGPAAEPAPGSFPGSDRPDAGWSDTDADDGPAGGNEPDFQALYRDLGLGASVTLEELRQHYRRRVALWHPDRGPVAARVQDRLKLLNLRYSAALDFHRRHGCLPHAGPALRPPRAEVFPMAQAPAAQFSSRSPRSLLRWLVLASVAGAAWLLWPGKEAAVPAPLAVPASTTADPAKPVRELQLGLRRQAVLQLLGEPITRDERAELWSYGPSWVQFECGRVAGWYNSALLGLRSDGIRPAERVGKGPGDARHACAPELPRAADAWASGSID